MDNSLENLQSSIQALMAAQSETQEILFDEIDRAAKLTGVITQVRAMVERWVVNGCNADTSRDLAQLVLAAIVTQAPETATLLSEHEALKSFVPEAYQKALSAKVSLEEAQALAYREILEQRNTCPGGVQ